MKSILITFADDVERDKFLAVIKGIDDEIVSIALNAIKLDPPIKEDHERICSLWITGQKIMEGNLTDLNLRFEQEIDVHSGSVVIKELRGGEWHDIRARRKQVV